MTIGDLFPYEVDAGGSLSKEEPITAPALQKRPLTKGIRERMLTESISIRRLEITGQRKTAGKILRAGKRGFPAD